jgi:hypothetical protein
MTRDRLQICEAVVNDVSPDRAGNFIDRHDI